MSELWTGKQYSLWKYRLGNWITVSGAAVVMNPEIKSAMTDNLNGTYSYSSPRKYCH